ncbi:MAG: JAB domain-containing protein [Steroidobacteraceae bacterium]
MPSLGISDHAVEIRLLDHLIIGDGCCTSLAEKGLI